MITKNIDTKEVLNAYFKSLPSYCEPYGNGHINDTFWWWQNADTFFKE